MCNQKMFSIKMLLSSYKADKSVKIIHLPDSGKNEHTDLNSKHLQHLRVTVSITFRKAIFKVVA